MKKGGMSMFESFKKAFGTMFGFCGAVVAFSWLMKVVKEEAKKETKETAPTDDDFLE
jgi:hypothetical protein